MLGPGGTSVRADLQHSGGVAVLQHPHSRRFFRDRARIEAIQPRARYRTADCTPGLRSEKSLNPSAGRATPASGRLAVPYVKAVCA